MELRIRNATLSDVKDGARLHVETWQSAYRGLMPNEFLQSLKIEDFEKGWQNAINSIDESRLKIVAEIEDRIVGFIAAGPSRSDISEFPEELHAIYVHPKNYGKGIGRKLLESYIEWLRLRKKDSFVLWVLKDNLPARCFYEATGGIELHQEKTDRAFGGVSLIEVAYGWRI